MEPGFLRGSDILERCKDAVFREMGECIHLFKVRVPRFVKSDATDRTFPLVHAEVHPTADTADPRLPGGAVPAALKWLNDSIDNVEQLSTRLAGCSLEAEAETVQPAIVSRMRSLDGQASATCVDWAVCSDGLQEPRNTDRRRNADLWDQHETDAVEHVVHSLTSLGLKYSVDVDGASLHGMLSSGAGNVQVVAIRGETHEDCRRHYDIVIKTSGINPVLVIARDHDNTEPTPEEFRKYYRVEDEAGLKFLAYDTLLKSCRHARTVDALGEELDGYLPGEPKII